MLTPARLPPMPSLGRFSSRSDTQIDRCGRGARVDHAIAALAEHQHGLVALAQLAELEVSAEMIRSRVRRGLWHRLHRGVYSVGHRPITSEARWLGAVLACGDGALLSHRSAAALWEIRPSSSARIDVTATGRRGYGNQAIALHRATTLAPVDRAARRGVPVTTLPRTIVDLATVVSLASLEYAIHRAEARRKLKPAELHEIVARLSGRRGVGSVRAIIGRPGHALDSRVRGPYELRFLAICRAYRIPMPEVNVWIPLETGAGGLEVDFVWPAQRLAVEVDERAGHYTLRALRNDPERDRALAAAGWRVVRVAQAEFPRPAEIARKVHWALGVRSTDGSQRRSS